MKTIFNAKDDTYTLKGITSEQIEIICQLVNTAQMLTARPNAREAVKNDGAVNLGELGTIFLSEKDIDVLHTIDI